MQVVSIGKDALKWRAAGSLYPGTSYLFSDSAVETLHEQERLSGFRIIERADYALKGCPMPYDGESNLRGSLLVYNTAALGDQLWTTAVVRAIKERNPRLAIDAVVNETNDILWNSNRDIRSCRMAPVPFESIGAYDYTLFYDEYVGTLKTLEQGNCYEELFKVAGLTAPADAKPNVRPLHKHERSVYHDMIPPDENGMITPSRLKHFVVGLHASSEARNLSKEQLIEFVATLAAQAPNQKIYTLSNDDFGGKLNLLFESLPNVIPCHNRLNLLQIAAMCRYASCVISTDSMLVHLAASQNAPTVAIASTVPPKYRWATYPFCVPIYKANACRFTSSGMQECFYKNRTFDFKLGETSEQSKCYTPLRVHCDVLAAVTVAEIFEAINIAMKRKNDRGGYDMTDLPLE